MQMIEKVGMESSEESSTHKEVIRTIATGVNSLKSKLISVTNKNKKMWRAIARNAPDTVSSLIREQLEEDETCDAVASPGRYNLRSTPTRRASAASKTRRQSAKPVASQLQVEERSLSGSGEEFANLIDKEETQPTCISDESIKTEEAGELTTTDTKETSDTNPEEPSMCNKDQHLATITVPITDLERAKQMAQQLTALITSLEHQQSSTFDSPKQ